MPQRVTWSWAAEDQPPKPSSPETSVGGARCITDIVEETPVRVAESQPEVEADTVFQAVHFAWVQKTASSVQAGLVHGVQIGRVDIALVVTGEAGIAVYPHVRARRSLSPGYYRDRYRAQSPNQRTDSEHDDRVIAHARKVRIPHLATQRLHSQPRSAGMTASGNGAGRPP